MSRAAAVWRAAVLVGCLAAVPFAWAPAVSAAPPPGSRCGVNLDAPQIAMAVRSLPPAFRDLDAPWETTPYDGNFDPCATLSAALVTVVGATGSSPEQALLFHFGEYLGTGTSAPYPFTTLDAARSSDDTVVLTYKDGRNVCTACAGPVHVVRYQWQDDHVEMLDPPPPSP